MTETILLLDVMSTLVTEPFYEDIPRFFGQSLEELRKGKDHQAFLDFERGLIDEDTYGERFYLDRRGIDVAGLKQCLFDSYQYMEGVEELLTELQDRGYRMYALSNYSMWYKLIEEKLKLSKYLDWSYVSCHTGYRKPDPQSYLIPAEKIGVPAERCLFVDDRKKNTDGAEAVGMRSILRTPSMNEFRDDLRSQGILE